MINVTRITLDVLKPHQPNGLEFASMLAQQCTDCIVNLSVNAVDENTESVVLVIEGENLVYDALHSAIQEMGGSVHSIDEVRVVSIPDTTDQT